MREDMKEVLIDSAKIAKIVKELGGRISQDYYGRNPLIIGVLKGSFIFLSDLVRNITVPCQLDFMAISSYGDKAVSSGEVKIIKDLDTNIEGRHVIVVEDILDSGNTLSYLLRLLSARKPQSLAVCVLLDKPQCRKPENAGLKVDYTGQNIPDEFIVGYGLDYGEKYRNLPDIFVLKPEVYGRR